MLSLTNNENMKKNNYLQFEEHINNISESYNIIIIKEI